MNHPEAISKDNTEMFRAIVGPNWTEYYEDAWTHILMRKGRGASINWAAFFLAGFWLPFRKMYLATGVFYGIVYLSIILEDVYFIGVRGATETPRLVVFGVNTLLVLICGAYGNKWYLLHAVNLIDVVGKQGQQRDTLLETLSDRGGRSWVAGIVVPFMASIAFGILYVFLVEPLLYPAH